MKKKNQGFTLVEMVVVIVVLAILIGVVITGILHYADTANNTSDIDNASSIYTTLRQLEVDDDICNWSYTESKTSPDEIVTVEWSSARSNVASAKYTEEDPKIKGDLYLSDYIGELLENGLPSPSDGGYFTIDFYVNGTKPYIVVRAFDSADTMIAEFGGGTRMSASTGKDLFTDDDDDSDNDEKISEDTSTKKDIVDKFKLVIHYVTDDGEKLYDDKTFKLNKGEEYSYPSPTKEGFEPDKKFVASTTGLTSNEEVTVTYSMLGIIDKGTYFGVPWYIDKDYTLHLAYKGDAISVVEDSKYWVDWKYTTFSNGDSYPYPGVDIGTSNLPEIDMGITSKFDIKRCIIENNISFSKNNIDNNGFLVGLFYDEKNLSEIVNLNKLSTKYAKYASGLFYNCSKLTNLDLSNFNFNDLKAADDMFYNVDLIETINTDAFGSLTNLESASHMFCSCSSLSSLDTSEWNLRNLESAESMFSYCKNLKFLDTSNWNITDKLYTSSNMFAYCINLNNLDVSKWNMSSNKYVTRMFGDCQNLTSLDTKNWNLEKVYKANEMFVNCYVLKKLDTSNWKFGGCKSFESMFFKCYALENIDVKGWVTKDTEDLLEMFYHCDSFTRLDVSDWNTENVRTFAHMFAWLQKLESLDLSGWRTPNATSSYSTSRNDVRIYSFAFSSMFLNCSKLEYLDLRGFDTSNVTSLARMFDTCSNLKKVDGLENFDTKNVKSLFEMFFNCGSLEMIDMTTWDLSNIEDTTDKYHFDMTGEKYNNNKKLRLLDSHLKFPIKIYNGQDFLPHVS